MDSEDDTAISGASGLSAEVTSQDGGTSQQFESIKVLVRVRPLSEAERSENNDSVVDVLSDQSLRVSSADGKKTFTCSFDAVLNPIATQSDVYRVVRGCTEAVLDGINSTIFAYGQTGSGKTHSMYGPPNYNSSSSLHAAPRDTQLIGLIPRAVNEIFELAKGRSVQDFQVHCSFVQIYNENLFDMLRDASMNTPLAIREDKKEIYVQGLSEYNVKSVSDTLQLLRIAEENRAIRETHMNLFSSRSHSIFQIQVEYKRVLDSDSDDIPDDSSLFKGGGGEVTYRAKFNLVDLAGSEKWNTKQYMRDEHIAEMTNINLSLHTLGKCISSLAQASKHMNQHRRENKSLGSSISLEQGSLSSLSAAGSARVSSSSNLNRAPSSSSLTHNNSSSSNGVGTSFGNEGTGGVHIPFRESKLTRLLQDSLGGNAKTFLIATVSPARANAEETISTLKFADRAKQVMVQAIVNESRPVDHKLVKRLQQEIDMLKSLVKRLMQSQQIQQHPSTGGAGFALPPSPGSSGRLSASGSFTSLLKQANSASQLQRLADKTDAYAAGVASAGGGTGAGAGSPMRHAGAGIASRDQDGSRDGTSAAGGGELNSPQRMPMGSPSRLALPPGAGTGEGTTMEYVISLEKALNVEQVNCQHVMKKNETLIKELEALKFENMRLVGGGGGGVGGGAGGGKALAAALSGDAGALAASKFFKNRPHYQIDVDAGAAGTSGSAGDGDIISVDDFHISKAQAAQVLDSVERLVGDHKELWGRCDSMQKVIKKFFKFQIEEEEMKAQLSVLFDELKEMRGRDASSRVVDNFAFLQFIANTAAKTPKPQRSAPTTTPGQTKAQAEVQEPTQYGPAAGGGSNSRTPVKSMQQGVGSVAGGTSNSGQYGGKSSFTFENGHQGVNPRNLPSMMQPSHPQAVATASAATAQQQVDSRNEIKKKKKKKKESAAKVSPAPDDYASFSPQHQSDPYAHAGDPQQRAAAAVRAVLHVEEVPSRASSSNSIRGDVGGGSSSGRLGATSPLPQQTKHSSAGGNTGGGDANEDALAQYYAAPALTQSRSPSKLGGMAVAHDLQPGPLNLAYRVRQGPASATGGPGSNPSSSVHSSGGWVQPLPEAEAEEALKKELRKAKKKLKKQQQMEEWQREKEARAEEQRKQQEEERKAEERAEQEREARRKARAEQQKQKLSAYQERVKSEAEKLQELKNLGIDPSSLRY